MSFASWSTLESCMRQGNHFLFIVLPINRTQSRTPAQEAHSYLLAETRRLASVESNSSVRVPASYIHARSREDKVQFSLLYLVLYMVGIWNNSISPCCWCKERTTA